MTSAEELFRVCASGVTDTLRERVRLLLRLGEVAPEIRDGSNGRCCTFDYLLDLTLREERCQLFGRAGHESLTHEFAEHAVGHALIEILVERPVAQQLQGLVEIVDRSRASQDAVLDRNSGCGRSRRGHADAVDVACEDFFPKGRVIHRDCRIVVHDSHQSLSVFFCREAELFLRRAQEHMEFGEAEEDGPLELEVGLEHPESECSVAKQRERGHLWREHWACFLS